MEASNSSGKQGFFILVWMQNMDIFSEDRIQPSIQSVCLTQNWWVAVAPVWLVVLFLLNAERVMNALLN